MLIFSTPPSKDKNWQIRLKQRPNILQKIYESNGPWKQEGVASDKLDFKTKVDRKDNDCYFILIKGTINQEEITIVISIQRWCIHLHFIYTPGLNNTDRPQNSGGEKLQYTSVTNRYIMQTKKVNKETLEFNDTLDQVYLRDFYRVFHSAIAQWTFFSAIHGIFSKRKHMKKPLAHMQ
jgi:hypothetical protein